LRKYIRLGIRGIGENWGDLPLDKKFPKWEFGAAGLAALGWTGEASVPKQSRSVSLHNQSEGEVRFVVEKAVFVADYYVVGPGWSGGDQEAQVFDIGVGRDFEG
jgi:hypothetical protein